MLKIELTREHALAVMRDLMSRLTKESATIDEEAPDSIIFDTIPIRYWEEEAPEGHE